MVQTPDIQRLWSPSIIMNDPWDWTIDRVVQEFCTPNRTWKPVKEPVRLPDSVQLEKSLREHEVDGYVLLDAESKELCSELSIKVIHHKVTFTNAINQLRRKSPGYKSAQRQKENDEQEAEQQTSQSSESSATNGGPQRGPDDVYRANAKRRLRAMIENSALADVSEPAHSITLATAQETFADPNQTACVTQIPVSGSPAKKKRRVAPQLISTEVNSTNINKPIPTAADVVTGYRSAEASQPFKPMTAHPYLYSKGVSRLDFRDGDFSLKGDAIQETEDGWSFLRRMPAPAGTQRQALLIVQNRLASRQTTKRHRLRPDTVEGADDPGLEKVLPIYGQSDDEDEYDDDTWAEIQKEAEEKKPPASKLSPAEVEAVIDASIQTLSDTWRERKLPRLERTAYAIWKRSRGAGLRRSTQELQKSFVHLETRLGSMKKQFMVTDWRSKADLGAMIGTLEATVNDRETARWTLGIVHSPTAPAKPTRQAQLRKSKAVDNVTQINDDEEEILSSDDEVDLRGFVVDTEIEIPGDDDPCIPMDVDSEPEPEPGSQLLGEAENAQRQATLETTNGVVEDHAVPDTRGRLSTPPSGQANDGMGGDNALEPELPAPAPETIHDDVEVQLETNELPGPLVPDTHVDDAGVETGTNAGTTIPASKASPRLLIETPRRPQSYEFIDLTGSPVGGESGTAPSPTQRPTAAKSTPHATKVAALKQPKIKQESSQAPSSPFASSCRKSEPFPFNEPRKSFLEMGIDDVDPIPAELVRAIDALDDFSINAIFSLVKICGQYLWEDFVKPVYAEHAYPNSDATDGLSFEIKVAYRCIRLFDIWNDQAAGSFRKMKKFDRPMREQHISKIDRVNFEQSAALAEFLLRISDRFAWKELAEFQAYHRLENQPHVDAPQADDEGAPIDEDVEEYGAEDEDCEASRAPSTLRKKKRTTALDRAARDLRQSDLAAQAEQAARRRALKAKLQAQGAVSESQFIINMSKADDEGLIYVHPEIARRIKMHQVEGVRFMWNQIVQKGSTRQGCLLAHSMGLGKTMQIITLLVAITEASRSEDESIRQQVPEDLREPHFLILCPPTLVANWFDELVSWTAEDHALGEFLKVDSKHTDRQREEIIRNWDKHGGVLLLPYTIFRSMADDPNLKTILLDRPNLVVADEAHLMKNPKSKLHMAAAHFSTKSRIAMTGSPLANNVEEYHAMVNWIAPNYLSDIKAFRDHFARPIHEGLQITSSVAQRRKMSARLLALKTEVAPKVDRKTLAVLKNSIPNKTEFVLVVPLTKIQRKAYELLIQYQQGVAMESASENATIFATLSVLALLCAHPQCFKKRLLGKEPSRDRIATLETTTGLGDEEPEEPTYANLNPQLVAEELSLLHNIDRHREDLDPLSWKIKMFLAIVRESQKCGDSVLVFSQSIPTLDYLEKTLRQERIETVRLDGKTKMAIRQDMVKKFNKGTGKVFMISTTAGGLGLNITGANRVIIFDFKFNPQHEQQAIGRAYRIGQTKEVFVYRLICGGTFEEKMLDRVVFKMQLAQRVVDKTNPIPKAQEMAKFLDMPDESPEGDVEKYRGRDGVLDALIDSADIRTGLRSIMTMDTFEEEELEDAEVSAEEQAEAEQLLRLHRGPALGQATDPTPAALLPHQNFDLPLSAPIPVSNLVRSPLSVATTRDSVVQELRAPIPASLPTSHTDGTVAQEVTPVAPIPTPFSPATQMNGHVGTAVPLAPIAGASMSTRVPGSDEYFQSQRRVFRGELKRAFTQPGSTPLRASESEKRQRIALKIADAIAEMEASRDPNYIKELRDNILLAAGTERFVQGFCCGIANPENMSNMSPERIKCLCDAWNNMDNASWERVLLMSGNTSTDTIRSNASRGDPEHLQPALQRMQSTANGDPASQKHHHLGDKAAMEAVMAHRSDQPSTQAKATKFKPLPNWADEAVKHGKSRQSSLVAPLPSTAPPQTVPVNLSSPTQSPSSAQRPRKPKNPFLSD
ncbi:transcriptional regulator ATRX [Microdochium nivale]|nr:transcriptional regulator ATRX [Microdochium nivale]